MNSTKKAPRGNPCGDDVHDTSVMAMEVHEEKEGKLIKIKGYRIGGIFVPINMSRDST